MKIKNTDMLNSIREQQTLEYQGLIPVVHNQDDCLQVLATFEAYPTAKNAFINTLTNRIANFSSKADIYCEGVNIVAPSFNNLYHKVTGTSFSTAIMCGYGIVTINQYIEKHGKKPTKNQLLKILKEVFPYE